MYTNNINIYYTECINFVYNINQTFRQLFVVLILLIYLYTFSRLIFIFTCVYVCLSVCHMCVSVSVLGNQKRASGSLELSGYEPADVSPEKQTSIL